MHRVHKAAISAKFLVWSWLIYCRLGLSNPVSSTIKFFDSMQNTKVIHLLVYPITKYCKIGVVVKVVYNGFDSIVIISSMSPSGSSCHQMPESTA